MIRMLAIPLGEGAELRALEPWNAEEFFAHIDEVRPHIKPWVPMGSSVTNLEKARTLLQRFADQQARDEARFYGIWVNGKLHGGTLIRDLNWDHLVCEIGVWLSPEAQGRGLINKACTHMISWLKLRGIKRVEWHSDPGNRRSNAAAQRLGFVYEGSLKSHFLINGERRDTEMWGLILG